VQWQGMPTVLEKK